MRHSLSALSSHRRRGLSGLGRAHAMMVRGFKDGNHSWIDVMPSRLAPAMRITHTIGADLRKPPSFAGFAGLGAPAWGGTPWAPGRGPARPPRNVKCIQSGVGNAFCWRTDTGDSYWLPKRRGVSEAPVQLVEDVVVVAPDGSETRILKGSHTKTGPVRTKKLKTGTLKGFNCRSSGSGRVFCWNDEDVSQAARFYEQPGMEGLMGLGAAAKRLTKKQLQARFIREKRAKRAFYARSIRVGALPRASSLRAAIKAAKRR